MFLAIRFTPNTVYSLFCYRQIQLYKVSFHSAFGWVCIWSKHTPMGNLEYPVCLNLHVFGLWGQTGGNPPRQWENTQTLHRQACVLVFTASPKHANRLTDSVSMPMLALVLYSLCLSYIIFSFFTSLSLCLFFSAFISMPCWSCWQDVDFHRCPLHSSNSSTLRYLTLYSNPKQHNRGHLSHGGSYKQGLLYYVILGLHGAKTLLYILYCVCCQGQWWQYVFQ